MTIDVSLGEESIEAALARLRGYKTELTARQERIVERCVSVGESEARAGIQNHIDTGETIASVKGEATGSEGRVKANGAAVWLEFGTGVIRNGAAGSSPHPKGAQLGFLIGTYGKGQGASESGWTYYKNGQFRHAEGVAATMFMYRALQSVRRALPDIGKSAFRMI